MLKIGNLLLKNYLIMAPMAGITNPPFRLIAKRLGAGLVVTEMVSAVGLSRGHEKTFRYLESTPEEKPLSVQIFGADPYDMAMAAEIAVEKGADLVDINMGCPARKVVKNGAGASSKSGGRSGYGRGRPQGLHRSPDRENPVGLVPSGGQFSRNRRHH